MAASFAIIFFMLIALASNLVEGINELSNVSLRCCVIELSPYVMRDSAHPETAEWSGLAIDYLIQLRNRLGFTCSTFRDYKTLPFATGNLSSFSGFAEYFRTCSRNGSSARCECDIGVGPWTWTAERISKIDYVASFSSEEYGVVTNSNLVRSGPSSKFFFFGVFTLSVWGAMAGLLMLHVLVTALDSNFGRLKAPEAGDSNTEPAARSSFGSLPRRNSSWFRKSFLYRLVLSLELSTFRAIGHVFETEGHRTSTKERIMCFIALVMSILFVTIFQASATYQVLLNVPVSEFRSVDDFRSCKIPPNKVCITMPGAASRLHWDRLIAKSSCIASGEFGGPIEVASYAEGFKAVQNGTCEYFLTLKGQIQWESNGKYCNQLTPVGKTFQETMVSFILPKKSPLSDRFNLDTLHLRETNQLKNITQYASSRICHSRGSYTIGWDKLQIFFYISFAALVAMLIVTLISHRRKNDSVPPDTPRPSDTVHSPDYFT